MYVGWIVMCVPFWKLNFFWWLSCCRCLQIDHSGPCWRFVYLLFGYSYELNVYMFVPFAKRKSLLWADWAYLRPTLQTNKSLDHMRNPIYVVDCFVSFVRKSIIVDHVWDLFISRFVCIMGTVICFPCSKLFVLWFSFKLCVQLDHVGPCWRCFIHSCFLHLLVQLFVYIYIIYIYIYICMCPFSKLDWFRWCSF